MTCASNKVGYNSKEEAEEALVKARARYRHGPVSFYLCQFCGMYHLTSKGTSDVFLNSEEAEQRIKKEQEASYWEARLKNGF